MTIDCAIAALRHAENQKRARTHRPSPAFDCVIHLTVKSLDDLAARA
jgi:hypothetical protein